MIRVVECKSRRDMKKFVTFPLKLYKKCPYYVPSIYGDEMNITNPKKNLSYGSSEAKCFLAYNNNVVVGRICAIINHNANKLNNEKAVRFSRIDMIDDIEVTKALLEAVKDFGRNKGMEIIQGPWGFDDADREGMLTMGYEEYSSYACAYSYPYYVKHLEELGYLKESEWVEYRVDKNSIDPRYDKVTEMLKNRGYRDLCDTMKASKIVKKYSKSFFECYNKSYAELDNFAPVDDRQIKAMIDTFAVLINGRYFSVIVNKEDKVVAFCVGIPYIGGVLKKHNGHLISSVPGILKQKRKPSKIELVLIGVDPEYRNTGVHAMGVSRFAKHFKEDAIKDVFFDPTLTTNAKMLNSFAGFDRSLRCARQTFRKGINE